MSQEEYDDLDKTIKTGTPCPTLSGSPVSSRLMTVHCRGKRANPHLCRQAGKVIETVSRTEPKAGNDIYLTIDKDLQINAYHLLEERSRGLS